MNRKAPFAIATICFLLGSLFLFLSFSTTDPDVQARMERHEDIRSAFQRGRDTSSEKQETSETKSNDESFYKVKRGRFVRKVEFEGDAFIEFTKDKREKAKLCKGDDWTQRQQDWINDNNVFMRSFELSAATKEKDKAASFNSVSYCYVLPLRDVYSFKTGAEPTKKAYREFLKAERNNAFEGNPDWLLADLENHQIIKQDTYGGRFKIGVCPGLDEKSKDRLEQIGKAYDEDIFYRYGSSVRDQVCPVLRGFKHGKDSEKRINELVTEIKDMIQGDK